MNAAAVLAEIPPEDTLLLNNLSILCYLVNV